MTCCSVLCLPVPQAELHHAGEGALWRGVCARRPGLVIKHIIHDKSRAVRGDQVWGVGSQGKGGGGRRRRRRKEEEEEGECQQFSGLKECVSDCKVSFSKDVSPIATQWASKVKRAMKPR